MNKKQPLVSVIIPTYNRSSLLQKAVQSVLNQSYQNIEILIIDDGSTDDTSLVVEGISKKFSKLIYKRKSNGGCASARNKGLEHAKGKFITFLDSDDQWEPTSLEKMVETLEKFKVNLVYSPSIEVFVNGREIINLPVASGDPDNIAVAHFLNTNVRNGSFMFDRSVLTEVGLLDETLIFNEDSDFFQHMTIHFKAAYLPDPTVRHLNHEGNKSRNRIEIYKALLKSSEKILVNHPDFAMMLGKRAENRIRQLKIQLLESLILASNWLEAQTIANEINGHIYISHRLALSIRRNQPLKIGILFRKILKKLRFSITDNFLI